MRLSTPSVQLSLFPYHVKWKFPPTHVGAIILAPTAPRACASLRSDKPLFPHRVGRHVRPRRRRALALSTVKMLIHPVLLTFSQKFMRLCKMSISNLLRLPPCARAQDAPMTLGTCNIDLKTKFALARCAVWKKVFLLYVKWSGGVHNRQNFWVSHPIRVGANRAHGLEERSSLGNYFYPFPESHHSGCIWRLSTPSVSSRSHSVLSPSSQIIIRV